MKGPDSVISRKLSCKGTTSLDDLIRDFSEVDSGTSGLKLWDIIAVAGGVYHVEISGDFKSLIKRAINYAGSRTGISRLKRLMKFFNIKYLDTRLKTEDFSTYHGSVLGLGELIAKEALTVNEMTILLSLTINEDPDFKVYGGRSFCVYGPWVSWSRLRERVLAVRFDISGRSYLLIPAINRIEEVTRYPIKDSAPSGAIAVYESPSKKLVMLGEYNPIFRKRSEEVSKEAAQIA
jgi:hypothetical protein